MVDHTSASSYTGHNKTNKLRHENRSLSTATPFLFDWLGICGMNYPITQSSHTNVCT